MSFVNEYCRESMQYSEEVTNWKSTRKYQNGKILYIVAEDVYLCILVVLDY